MNREFNIPQIFLGGAQKSASTSLFNLLATHPQIGVYSVKEPNLFSRKDKLHNTVWKKVSDVLYLDGSVSYLYESYAASRIHNVSPNAKFIFILRNPARRAISAYLHLAKRFHEKRKHVPGLFSDCSTLTEAIQKENEGITLARTSGRIIVDSYEARYDEYLWPFRYMENSSYSQYLRPYFNLFGKENIKIVFFENFINDQHGTIDEICRFLDIPPIEKTLMPYNHSNVTKTYRVRYEKLHALCQKVFRSCREQDNGNRLLSKIERLFLWDIDGLVREYTSKLDPLFTPSIEELSRLIAIDVHDVWRRDY